MFWSRRDKKMVAEGCGHSRAFGCRIEEAESGAGKVLRLALRRTDEDALRRNLRQSVHHHPHVHFPPLLAGIINRNPRDEEGREQEQRNGTLNPTLRAGGDVALIAWIRLGHSVLKVVTTQLQPPAIPANPHCVLVVLTMSGSPAEMRECDQRNPARHRPPAQPHCDE